MFFGGLIMKNVLFGLLLTLVVLPLFFLATVVLSGLPPDNPAVVLVIALPLALLALVVTAWIQKWGKVRLLLSILIGPLLLLVIRLTFVLVDNWLEPVVNPNRLPLAIALNLLGIFLSFFAIACLYVWLFRKLHRQR